VLLLHGFPEFWWSWRHQLVAFGEAGFHAVAPDLRGYGATDKPPRGYDGFTLASDVAGLVRALGARDAWVVGHDWGGALAWATASLHPSVVNRVGVLSCPHPLRFAEALRQDRTQLRMSGYMAGFQLPKVPEKRLQQGDLVQQLMRRWAAPGFPDAETVDRCREAMNIPSAASCSLEYYRWAFRSRIRPSGWRFSRLLAEGVRAPVLQLHGELDGGIRPETAHGSGVWAHGEAPELVTDLLLEHARA
jgi:pimeloyl-ACP methyl ester carboxylesterase